MISLSPPQKIFFHWFLVVITLLVVSGCVVGPDYEPPTLAQEINLDVTAGEFTGVLPQEADIGEWWKIFDDPILTRLIDESFANNIDLRMALSRLDESRARLGITKTEMLFTVDGNVGANSGLQSESLTNSSQSTRTYFGAGLDASWELDLWGKVRRKIESDTASYQASEEELNDMLITICADVARTYFTIRTLESRIAKTASNIANQKTIVKLTKDRFNAGIGSKLEVSQAVRDFATSQATLPPLRTSLGESINSLSILLGKQPGYVNSILILAPVEYVPLPPANVAIGIPAERIRNRPDVRQAERLLAAQTARIGVAKADLYPTLSLTGSVGTAALSTSDLFTGSSAFYSFVPSLRLNIFNRGRIRDQIVIEDARTEQALGMYEKTLLNAIKDVEDSLVAYHEQQLQLSYLDEAKQAAKSAMSKSEDLYASGLIDFQNVLDAQRILLDVENEYENGRGNTSILLVRLYRSLAGGWRQQEPEAVSTSETTAKHEL